MYTAYTRFLSFHCDDRIYGRHKYIFEICEVAGATFIFHRERDFIYFFFFYFFSIDVVITELSHSI